jgi:hypothetical protein
MYFKGQKVDLPNLQFEHTILLIKELQLVCMIFSQTLVATL